MITLGGGLRCIGIALAGGKEGLREVQFLRLNNLQHYR